MSESKSILDAIDVKSPCSMNWDRMAGDERTRHCRACRLNVYNLSEMTREEAENLIREKEGRLCARFHRRPDGTILTKDCGAVVATRKRRRIAASLVFFLGLVAAAFAAARNHEDDPVEYGDFRYKLERYISPVRQVPALGPAVNKVIPPPKYMTMGAIACR